MRLIQFTAADGWRGHEQKIIYLAEAFRDLGLVEDQWIICRNDSIMKKVATEKGLNVLAYDFKSEYDLKFAKKLKQISTEVQADIIFIHSSKAHTIAVLSSMFYQLKQPLVLCRTLVEKVDTNFFRKWKYNYHGIKKIICLTQAVVDVLSTAIKDHSRFSIVGPITDLKKFTKKAKNGSLHKEFNIPNDYSIIGNIAAFVPVKDHITWINTVEELHKRGLKAKYILIGEGPTENEMKELVKSKGLEDEIIFAGFRTDIPQMLPEFDMLLFTSNNEAAGGVILEAYACKVPVVATNAAGIPEILEDHKTGLLAATGDHIDFAMKTEYLLSNKELQAKLTENGYDYLIQNFTKEVVAKKMFEELNNVLVNSN